MAGRLLAVPPSMRFAVPSNQTYLPGKDMIPIRIFFSAAAILLGFAVIFPDIRLVGVLLIVGGLAGLTDFDMADEGEANGDPSSMARPEGNEFW